MKDIYKVFDKVWLEGLQYKLTTLEMPEVLEKILISFTQNRTAKIKYKNTISDIINIRSGVPQGSVISPSLYITYTADLPPPGPNNLDILFADDVTQIVEYPHTSKKMLAIRSKREIERINNYEKNGK